LAWIEGQEKSVQAEGRAELVWIEGRAEYTQVKMSSS